VKDEQAAIDLANDSDYGLEVLCLHRTLNAEEELPIKLILEWSSSITPLGQAALVEQRIQASVGKKRSGLNDPF
jgi:acyl-CoA reductase-like NAD-dependent aldehyde dehydrogenase